MEVIWNLPMIKFLHTMVYIGKRIILIPQVPLSTLDLAKLILIAVENSKSKDIYKVKMVTVLIFKPNYKLPLDQSMSVSIVVS